MLTLILIYTLISEILNVGKKYILESRNAVCFLLTDFKVCEDKPICGK